MFIGGIVGTTSIYISMAINVKFLNFTIDLSATRLLIPYIMYLIFIFGGLKIAWNATKSE